MSLRPRGGPSLTLDDAVALAERGNVIPLTLELPGDVLTPVAAFLKLAAGRPHAFLLESVEGGERIGRYSFLGFEPWRRVVRERLPAARGGEAELPLTGPAQGPFGDLRRPLHGLRPVALPDLPPFTGGVVGVLAYDAVRAIEHLPRDGGDELRVPDLDAAFYDTIVAFDHLRQRIQIVSNLLPGRDDRSVKEEYALALHRIEAIAGALVSSGPTLGGGGFSMREAPVSEVEGPRHGARSVPADEGARGASSRTLGPSSGTLGRRAFVDRVISAKEEIARGEIFQVVLSRRLDCPFAGDPFEVYRALRSINPSPYNFHIRSGARALTGASPEMLVRVRDGRVETRPIAGTRPRGASDEDDARLAAELRADPKEMAEHLMLVDLGRNDIGRVCAAGTVRVPRFADIERYSHVMHMVSAVEGRLKSGLDAFDALASCFPAGTVSGAPKVRAMEIIDRLEPARRGPYAGAVFYRGFDGALDSAIAIRVVLIENGRASVQAGAGIVADSDPEREFEETESKAGAALAALARAGELS